MSDQPKFSLDSAINGWLKSFRKQQAFDEGSIQEMELHLRDHIEDLIAQGSTEKDAFLQAKNEFGEIPTVAKEEYSNIKRRRSLRTILFTTMLHNYFKTSTRHMLKNPLTSFINVFGLSVAIGVCIVVYAFVDMDYSIDRFHKNENEIYLSTFFVDRGGTEEQYGLSPTPLGTMLLEDFSGIQKMCRIIDFDGIIKFEENVFPENIRCVDETFLDIFTFPLKRGKPESLDDVNSIILSYDMSIKYFGDDNPIGQEVLLKFSETRSKTFIVSGVAEQFPKSHAVHFDFLINIENYRTANPYYDFNNWKNMLSATLIQVKNPEDMKAISSGMKKYKDFQNEVEKDWAISSFEFVKFKDLHFQSRNIRKDISHDNFYEGRIVLPILGIFMLALACFNYINMAIVSATKRLKEIGLRKVIGANRGRIIFQFLSENVFITLFALMLGILFAFTLFLPWFRDLSELDIDLRLLDVNLWLFLTLVLLVTGLVSGIYPALYISKFQVVNIFKGSVKFGKKNTLTKIFLGVQLVLACLGITSAVMFSQNSAYQAQRNWGYNQSGVLYTYVANNSMYRQLEASMVQNPHIMSTSGSSHHLGKRSATRVVRTPEREYEVIEMAVDHNYFQTLELELQSGRIFHPEESRNSFNVIANELLVKNLELDDPIGQTFKIDENLYQIVGIVKDFHFNNFYYENLPTIFTVANDEQYRFLSMRVHDGKEHEAYLALRNEWTTLFPETPFQGGYQEDVWGGFYRELEMQESFMKTIAYIAVLLAALGLYGLVTLNVAGRVREFSIRRVLGAGLDSIAINILKQYTILTLVAIILGAPISYLLAKANLDMMYPDPRPFGYSGVIIAVFILIGVLIAVISTQIRKVSKANPVEGLKVE